MSQTPTQNVPPPPGGTQIRERGTNDPRLYAPNRDVAHNFRFVVEEVARRLAAYRWDAYKCLTRPPSDEELGEAAKRFIEFVASAADDPHESMERALERVAFLELSYSAQLAYMATLGQVVSGIYFNGVRAATTGGVGPCSGADIGSMIKTGRLVAEEMRVPWWRRPARKLKHRAEEAIRVLRGK